MLLVPIYFVPVVVLPAIVVNKLVNRTLVSDVTTSTVLVVLHTTIIRVIRTNKNSKQIHATCVKKEQVGSERTD